MTTPAASVQTMNRTRDRHEQVQALVRRLEEGVSTLQNGEQFRRYLTVAARSNR